MNQILSYAYTIPAGTKRTRLSQRFSRGIMVNGLWVSEISIPFEGFQIQMTPIWTRSPSILAIGNDRIPDGDYENLIGGQSGQSFIYCPSGSYVQIPLVVEQPTDGYLGFIFENTGAQPYQALVMASVSQRLQQGTGL